VKEAQPVEPGGTPLLIPLRGSSPLERVMRSNSPAIQPSPN
jgi:hypothetical protein